MDLNIPPETTTELLVRYGLYISAIFQLICIAAVAILPEAVSESSVYGKAGEISDDEMWDSSVTVTPRHIHQRAKKQEKKKRK